MADDIDEARHRATDSISRWLAGGPAAAPAADLDVQFRTISGLIRTASIGPADPIPFDPWIEALDAASATLGTCSAAIWDLRTQQGGDRDEVRRIQFHVEQLYEVIRRSPRESIGQSDGWRTRLIACHRRSRDRQIASARRCGEGSHWPRFARSFSPRWQLCRWGAWRQVADQLGLTNTTPDELLGALDAAGEAAGTRALVMIDAINERGGIALWANRLAAFLATADRFAHVAANSSPAVPHSCLTLSARLTRMCCLASPIPVSPGRPRKPLSAISMPAALCVWRRPTSPLSSKTRFSCALVATAL